MSDLLNQASLVYIPSGYKEDTAYSVIPTDGSGDMVFSRASDGTRVNSQGLVERVPWNLAQYSADFTNGAWIKISASITGNTTTNPINGANDAETITGPGYISQNISSTGVNTFFVYAKANSTNTIRLNVYDGVIDRGASYNLTTGAIYNIYNSPISTNSENVGDGWWKISITINSANYSDLQIHLDTTGTRYIFGAQLNQGSTAKPYFPTTDRQNVPRLDYSNGCPSLLLEPQRTNLALYSEQFDTWSNVNATITANYGISPDGSQTADRYQRTAGTRGVVYRNTSVSSGTTYTVSIYAKSLNGTQKIRIGADSGCLKPQGAETFSVGETWTRIETQITSTQTSWNVFFDNVESGTACTGTYLAADFLVWGFQLEAGSYPTSYIPTTSASVTRVADAASKTGISSLIGQTEGVVFFDWIMNHESPNTSEDLYTLSLSDGTGNKIIVINNYNQTLAVLIKDTTTQFFNNSYTGGADGARIKLALGYANNDIALYINGTQIATDTSATIPTLNKIRLNSFWNGNLPDSLKVNQLLLFKTRLTNAELAALTTL